MSVWERKGHKKSKVFVVKVMLGTLPFEDKIAARTLSNNKCLVYQNRKQSIKHLLWERPIIKDLSKHVCIYFNRKFKLPFLKRDMVFGLKAL